MHDYRFMIDTALSTEGSFPTLTGQCLAVGIQGPHGYELILVSSRYTAPTDAAEAAEIAVDAYHERDDSNKVSGIVRLNKYGGWDYRGANAYIPC